MDKNDMIQHWSYFCSLAERIDETKHFIDHGLHEKKGKLQLIHGKVYSDVFKQIIVLAASEFEVMSKELCLLKKTEAHNIVEISKCILKEFPKITNCKVFTPFWINQPLENWKMDKETVSGLEWWRAYTDIKHGNKKSIQEATLENAIYSLEALYIINLYVMFNLIGNLRMAYEYPVVYFRCKYTAYATNSGEGKLPDYGDLSPDELIRQKYPDIFSCNS